MVYVIDDDSSVRQSLEELLREAELPVASFATAREFLKCRIAPAEPSCLVLDLFLSDANGLELFQDLSKSGDALPAILVTGEGSVSMSVKAMKAGVFDFMLKPFDSKELLAAIFEALERDRIQKQFASEIETLRNLVDLLTDRELQVFHAVIEGLLNKQISERLHIVEQTVKVHRARMMKKLKVTSVAAVVHIAEQLSHSGKLPAFPTFASEYLTTTCAP